MRLARILAIACAVGCHLLAGPAIADDAKEAFFESKIRPALVEHCLDCHSVETEASGGLTLDAAEVTRKGGDSGPAVVPGKPIKSLLLKAIEYDDINLQMPPDGKLPQETIDHFRTWIAQGAVDPREATEHTAPPQTGLPVERSQEHWAYRPLHRTAQNDLSLTAIIDQSIDTQLAELELAPTDEVLPTVFARRLYYDLTGLPPTPQQLASFNLACEKAADVEEAYEQLVDQLLADRGFGEHMARRWMDVARYADSITLRGFVLPQAWRYRDYLIHSFNEDRGFDRMIVEQVAGDLLQFDDEKIAEQRRAKIASGFLALGNTNLEQQDKSQLEMDYIDEQLEVVGRAFLGQTIGCARCHDHKFDPIPTADYYALAGIFRSAVGLEHENVSKWIERSLPLYPEEQAVRSKIEMEIKSTSNSLKELQKKQKESSSDSQGPIDPATLAGIIIDDTQAQKVGYWKESQYLKRYVGSGYIHDEGKEKGTKTLTFEAPNLKAGIYEVSLAFTAYSNRATSLSVQVFSAEGERKILLNQKNPRDYDGLWRKLGRFRFEENGQAYVLISNEGSSGVVIADAVRFLRIDKPGTNSDKLETKSQIASEHEAQQNKAAIKNLEEKLKQLKSRLADVSPKFLSVDAGYEPEDIAIHVRGSVHSLGEVVPRGFLSAINASSPQSNELDRLNFAEWLIDEDNPLTPRVYANRVWAWMMGQGLVTSVNNFGTTGTQPSHPELLDQLAIRFSQSGWSTKFLIKSIVLSKAYRRSTHGGSELQHDADPDNKRYWRAARKRLSAESIRDAMLLVSGELRTFEGGSLIPAGTKADYNFKHQSLERSVYQPVFRNSLPDLLEVFDFADSSVSTGQRPRSTVAPQALALMNHPWVIARAEAAARRFSSEELSSDELVELVYAHCYARKPTVAEQRLCVAYLKEETGTGEDIQSRLKLLIQTLFAAVDFRYLD